MKKLLIPFAFVLVILSFGCEEKDEASSEQYMLLTTTIWTSDSLLVNGMDASGPDEILENFNGDVSFNDDGTGTFGEYTGTWNFAENETQLVITTEFLPIQVATIIDELTSASLKIHTAYPDQDNPGEYLIIRMTFKAK